MRTPRRTGKWAGFTGGPVSWDGTSRYSFIAVYMMANKPHGTLYLGVTSDLITRVEQHKVGTFRGFTKRYGCKMLVWYREFEGMEAALACEHTMKGWPRDWKDNVIAAMNPEWRDLSLSFPV